MAYLLAKSDGGAGVEIAFWESAHTHAHTLFMAVRRNDAEFIDHTLIRHRWCKTSLGLLRLKTRIRLADVVFIWGFT